MASRVPRRVVAFGAVLLAVGEVGGCLVGLGIMAHFKGEACRVHLWVGMPVMLVFRYHSPGPVVVVKEKLSWVFW